MIYIPILKTLKEEYSIAKEMQYCFSEKIIPLFEIIAEKFNADEDIITLQNINAIVCGKTAFIDYFRFSLNKYGRNIDFNRAELSFAMNNDYELYKNKVLAVSDYDNFIPVISIKKDFDIPQKELEIFIKELQARNRCIALRITDSMLEGCKDTIKRLLRESDYFLFDIEEQKPSSKFMEIEEINEFGLKAKIILINSPRKLSVNNGEYPEKGWTDLIDNSAREIAKENNLDGYGDYCGLKDKMPMKKGSNGRGAALVLLFDFSKNMFYSYCNRDTSLWLRGYNTLIPQIKADRSFLDLNGDCPGIRKVYELNGNGSWPKWHHINAVRYIYQTYKNL